MQKDGRKEINRRKYAANNFSLCQSKTESNKIKMMILYSYHLNKVITGAIKDLNNFVKFGFFVKRGISFVKIKEMKY